MIGDIRCTEKIYLIFHTILILIEIENSQVNLSIINLLRVLYTCDTLMAKAKAKEALKYCPVKNFTSL
jgi:hypothetical protein